MFTNRLLLNYYTCIWETVNSFSAELFKVDSSMFKIGRLHSHVIKVLQYSDNLKANNADFRWGSSLRADSPESALFAKTLILPLALKELNLGPLFTFVIQHLGTLWGYWIDEQWKQTMHRKYIYFNALKRI